MKKYYNIFLFFDVRNIALNVADFEPEAFDFKVQCLNH
jgi:hypothetical protein